MEQKLINALERMEEHLEASRNTYSIKMSYRRAYRLLTKYMEDRNESYTNDIAKQWLHSLPSDFCGSTLRIYRTAIKKLDAAYHGREIVNTKEMHDARQHYQNLTLNFKTTLDTFLNEMGKTNGKSSIQQMRVSISRFLAFLSNRRISELENITHQLIVDFYSEDEHASYKSKDKCNDGVRRFLHYLADKGCLC